MPPSLIDLSHRAKFRLTGADRERYLNGQVTNQVARATPEAAIEACVCNVKGRLEGVVHLTRSSDGAAFWIDAPAELRDSLFARLGRYIIADDCELEDVTEERGLIHALGGTPDLPGASWRRCDRFGVPGWDLWVDRNSVARVMALGEELSERDREDLRIRHGVPAWGAELGHDTLPAEVGLDRRAVDFHKGCYVGQEIVSRVESVGRVNRVLVWLASDAEPAVAGAEVFPMATGGEPKAAGVVTSVTSDGRLALALLRRDFAEPETKLVLSDKNGKLASQIWEVRKIDSAKG